MNSPSVCRDLDVDDSGIITTDMTTTARRHLTTAPVASLAHGFRAAHQYLVEREVM